MAQRQRPLNSLAPARGPAPLLWQVLREEAEAEGRGGGAADDDTLLAWWVPPAPPPRPLCAPRQRLPRRHDACICSATPRPSPHPRPRSEAEIRAYFGGGATPSAAPVAGGPSAGAAANCTVAAATAAGAGGARREWPAPPEEELLKWFPALRRGASGAGAGAAAGAGDPTRGAGGVSAGGVVVLCFPNSGSSEDVFSSEGTGSRRAPSPLLVGGRCGVASGARAARGLGMLRTSPGWPSRRASTAPARVRRPGLVPRDRRDAARGAAARPRAARARAAGGRPALARGRPAAGRRAGAGGRAALLCDGRPQRRRVGGLRVPPARAAGGCAGPAGGGGLPG
jgi:hypothetical protein